MPLSESPEIIKAIQDLNESALRKLIRAFFSEYISDRNVQPYHGVGEHGKDTLAVISERNDPIGKGQVLFIQVKNGDISLSDWTNRISGQMSEASRSTIFPMGANRDSSRRLLLVLSGELSPEAFRAIKDWNQTQSIPVEVFDIWGLFKLFDKHNVKPSDFESLLELADRLRF